MAAALGLFLGSGLAAAQEEQRIISVDVRGATTVARETILAKVQTKAGGRYQEQVISDDIRRIFSLGYFTDVQTDVEELPDGLAVTFLVTENPSVEAIEVTGNRAISTKRVRDFFGLSAGRMYDPREVKEGIEKVEAEYGRKGFAEAKILSQATLHDTRNAVTVYLLVEEGPRLRISRILIEGNEAFSDRRVRGLIKTKRRRWWLFGHGVLEEQVLEEDLERIQVFYRKYGYQDVAVAKNVYEDPDGEGLIIHFTVTEGLQHRVGEIQIEGSVLFPEYELRQLLILKPGSVYNRKKLQEDLAAVKQYYGDRGYINAQVTPDVRFDDETKRVNLTYHIEEDELVYLNRIEIRGNLKTKDLVVRRELRVYPGEVFDGKKLRQSIDRLYNLGFFEEVSVDTQPTDDPGQEDLVVTVKETKTGSFSFGGGFSSIDRLVALIELEQRNFDWRNFPSMTGAGQDLRLRAQIGTVRRFFDISWTEPWIFGQPLAFGIDVYNRTRLRSRSLGLAFEEERRGGGIRFGKQFADFVDVGLKYQLFRTVISDIVADATADLKAEEGRSDISVAGLSMSFDRRNNRFDPVSGHLMYFSYDLAGGFLAGDKEFWRLEGGGSHYWSHGKRYVFESRIRTGVVNTFSNTPEVPIFERYFAGGVNTIRGFKERRVGPRDPKTNDPIGGETLLVATLEEVMTILEDERGRSILKGSIFFDIGNVWRRAGDFGTSYKSGAGFGARVNTPIGPVRLDLGFPISGVDDEKRKAQFHFNISRSF